MNPLTQFKKIRILPLLVFLSRCFIVITFFWSDWIEALTGYEPDNRSGSFEWGFVAGLLIINVIASMLAWVERRRHTWPYFGALRPLAVRLWGCNL
jgi:hypothetical protein